MERAALGLVALHLGKIDDGTGGAWRESCLHLAARALDLSPVHAEAFEPLLQVRRASKGGGRLSGLQGSPLRASTARGPPSDLLKSILDRGRRAARLTAPWVWVGGWLVSSCNPTGVRPTDSVGAEHAVHGGATSHVVRVALRVPARLARAHRHQPRVLCAVAHAAQAHGQHAGGGVGRGGRRGGGAGRVHEGGAGLLDGGRQRWGAPAWRGFPKTPSLSHTLCPVHCTSNPNTLLSSPPPVRLWRATAGRCGRDGGWKWRGRLGRNREARAS